PWHERDTQMIHDANHNGTDRVRYQAVTPDGRGAQRWRRPAARGRRPRRRAGSGAGLAGLEARALVSQIPTAVSAGGSSAAPVYGQVETFTATVTTPSGDPIPGPTDGPVFFYDGTTILGSATLAGSPATATFTTAALAVGPHTITARYFGDN